jgi:hypothetical protein
MPVFRYFTLVGSVLLVFLLVFGGESESRFDGALYESAMYLPRPGETATVAEFRFTRDASPADHVKEVFAQFVANEGRRGRR